MKKTKLTITLQERTEDHVRVYFEKVSDPEIKKWLPQRAKTVAEAVADFHKSVLPNTTSYGKTIYVNDRYLGDIWCYCIHEEEEPDAMVSYCVFDKSYWGQGIATQALTLFLKEIEEKYDLKHVGAFTYSENKASLQVLLKNGFTVQEEFMEDGVLSAYLQKEL